jgi:pyridoxine kinase
VNYSKQKAQGLHDERPNFPPILAIQSHVACGHVGNSATTFPLQRLGFDVWPVHTTQLSRHKGYAVWAGDNLAADHVGRVLQGLQAPLLEQRGAVLTGYLGSAAVGKEVAKFLRSFRATGTNTLVHCDPVIGDTGPGVYVEAALVDVYREEIIPLTNCLSPNLFELSVLVSEKLDGRTAAIQAARALIKRGPTMVLVTSVIEAESDQIATLLVTKDEAWAVETWLLEAEKIPNGLGDLTSALFLASLIEFGDPDQAVGKAVDQVYCQLEAAVEAGSREMQLVKNQELIPYPHWSFEILSL